MSGNPDDNHKLMVYNDDACWKTGRFLFSARKLANP